MKDISKLSVFAQKLRGLLSAECFPNGGRAQWARYLDVTESAISQWTCDKTIPRPIILLMIYNLVKDLRTEMAVNACQQFEAMAKRPIDKSMSPFYERMQPTVWDYMTGSPFDRSRTKYSVTKAGSANPEVQRIAEAQQESQLSRRSNDIHAPDYFSFAENKVLADGFICEITRNGDVESAVQVSNLEELGDGNILLTGPPGIGKTELLSQLYDLHRARGQTVVQITAADDIATFSKIKRELLAALETNNNEKPLVIIDDLNSVPQDAREAYRNVIARELAPLMRLVMVTRPTSFNWMVRDCVKVKLLELPVQSAHSLFRRKLNEALVYRPSFRGKSMEGISILAKRPYFGSLRKNPGFLSIAADVMSSSSNMMPEYAMLKGWTDGYLFRIGRRRTESQSTLLLDILKRLARAACFVLMKNGYGKESVFDTKVLAVDHNWQNSVAFAEVLYKHSDEQWLDLVSEETGVFSREDQGGWCIRHPALQEFLSADHIINSVESVNKLLGRGYNLKNQNSFRALRYACSGTTDASDLVKYILDHADGSEGERNALFAELFVSFFNADKALVHSCNVAVISWLDKTASSWQWSFDKADDSPIFWQARARRIGSPHSDAEPEHIVRILEAVHHSRLYDARRRQWRESFFKTKDEGVRQLASVLDEDGVFDYSLEDDEIRVYVRAPEDTWNDSVFGNDIVAVAG